MTINDGKELAVAPRPVVFVDFVFPDGATLYVASIAATFNGHTYDARIDNQQIDRLASLSEQGVDRVPSVTLVMADPSGSLFAAYERGHGFKGATLTLRFALADLSAGTFSTDNFIPFVGRCDQPSSDEKSLTVTAQSKLNLSQYMLPQAPIQVRCIWANPTTTGQRASAGDPTSLYFPCGETRDLTTAPPCAYSKQTCTQPNRYSGVTFDFPQTGSGREYISGNSSSWRNADTSGKYKEYWPVWLGGKAWVQCVSLNQGGDGNYTRGEAAVGIGEVEVSRVIVNGVELSQGGRDYFWGYSNNGSRDGTPNADAGYDGHGDPHGGQTVIEYRAPKTIIPPETPATIQVLGERAVDGHTTTPSSVAITSAFAGSGGNPGPIVIQFGRTMGSTEPGDGAAVTITGYSAGVPVNGAFTLRYLELPYDHATLQGTMERGSWGPGTLYYNQVTQSGGGPTPGIIKETLRLCGITADEISGPLMSTATAICNATITTTDGGGSTYSQPRFSSAVAVRQRRSAADIVRGLRQSIGGLLTVDNNGLIGIRMEGPLAEQQGSAVDGSNSTTPITSMLRNGAATYGYTAYRFDENNSWKLKRRPQSIAQMPNRVTFSFQDPVQEYAISSFSLVDSDDLERAGREVPGGLQVNPEGIASYNHALRCGRLGLNKIHRGNPDGDTRGTDWWEWETSFRACKLRIGDIVTLNDSRYSLTDQMVRITEIKPDKDYKTVTLAGHHHEDSWYLDAHGNAADPARTVPARNGVGTCVPPSFAVEVSALDPTVAELTGLAFTDRANAYSITAGTFAFYYVVEPDILTTLSAAITGTGASSMSVTSAAGIATGDLLQIGREVVLCGTPSGTTVPITRGQLATAADTALHGASVWLVKKSVQTVGFPLDFVNSAAITDWTLMQALPDTKLLSVGGSVTNAYGESATAYVPLTGTSDHGLKLNTASTTGTTLTVVNPTANTDYAILSGNVTVNVVATTRTVVITLPDETANAGGLVVVNRAAGSTHDVHVVPAGSDTIDGSGAAVEVLNGSTQTWAGVAS